MVDISPPPATGRIDLAEEPGFDVGPMRILPAERSVVMDGERRELQPRVMQVLVALAKARPAVVSRDRLIDLCWDGRIVGDDALNRCILAIRHLAQEFSPQPFSVETVPRVGHRLIERGSTGTAPGTSPSKNEKRFLGAIAAVFLILISAGLLVWFDRSSEAQPASIAVLPFRNLSAGDPYFAEGIGEEILSQLSREPQFRVAGSSSSSQLGSRASVGDAARLLHVDYVLEGSVRRQGGQVRVDVGLVRARDGIRLWSESYDGKLDDIFAIQRQIGSAIAGALKRKLVHYPALSGPLVTKGEAYTLYLTARVLIRTRSRRVGPTATDLLRDAIRIDPAYAPAWASLAEATQMGAALSDHEHFIAAVRQGRDYARHAIRLAPQLSEAHRALGNTFGYGDPEGIAHLRRAAALDPNNSENLIALGSTLGATGEFGNEVSAYQKANKVDPLWYRTTGRTAIALAELGDRAGAENLVRRSLPDKDANLHVALGRIAWTFADYSEAARHWSIVARSNSPRWSNTAKRTLNDAVHAVGIDSGPLEDVPVPPADRDNWRVWIDTAPSPSVWRNRNRDPIAAAVFRKHNLVGAKLMLQAGRWRELTATYDTAIGIQGIRVGRPVRADQLSEVPISVLALRAGGRSVEADRLVRESDALIRAIYRKGKTPVWFDAQAAAIHAVEGKRAQALTGLERAFNRGWRQNGAGDLRDIGDEPAFRALHGEPRFERLRIEIAAHYARERRELIALRLSARG